MCACVCVCVCVCVCHLLMDIGLFHLAVVNSAPPIYHDVQVSIHGSAFRSFGPDLAVELLDHTVILCFVF